MNNENYIAKYKNVEYLIHPAYDLAIDPKNQAEIANSEPNCKYITYYRGANNKLDLRFAEPQDHIQINFASNSNNGLNKVTDVYINSMNMDKIFFYADKTLNNVILHINMNHCTMNMDNFKITPQKARYIKDLMSFLPSLTAENNQPIFKSVSFENVSFTFSNNIKQICEKANIQSYGMICDERLHKGYTDALEAQKAVQFIKKPLSKLNLKTTKIDLTIEK